MLLATAWLVAIRLYSTPRGIWVPTAASLRALRQEHRAAEEYSVEFRWRVIASNWNNSTLPSQYHLGLSEEGKDAMVQFPPCDSLSSLIYLAININRCTRERMSEREAGLCHFEKVSTSSETEPIKIGLLRL